jgi:hypothetical protein
MMPGATPVRHVPGTKPGTYRHLLSLAVVEPVVGAHLCYPAGVWLRPVSTGALRLARRLLGRSRLTDRLPLGAPRQAVLAVSPSRVMVWSARIGGGGAELIGEIASWPHDSLTLARTLEELVSRFTDSDGDSHSSRTKTLRYRIGTPDGELVVDVPAGRGPAAELDRALVAALMR